MALKRTLHRPEFKAEVALEALHHPDAIAELSARYGVSMDEIIQWKEDLEQHASLAFYSDR